MTAGTAQQRILTLIRLTPVSTEQAKEGSVVGGGQRPRPPPTPPYLRHNFSNRPAAKPALTPQTRGFIVAISQLALEEVYL